MRRFTASTVSTRTAPTWRYLFKGEGALGFMDGGDGFAANAAAAVATYAALDVDPTFANSNSPDCQRDVLAATQALAAAQAAAAAE